MVNQLQSLMDVLEPGESALAVITDGRHLQLNGDGTGSSGNWVADPDRVVDRFAIYHRDGRAGDVAQVYRTTFLGTEPSLEPGRLVVKFKAWELVGHTRSSWPEFADTGANPVRYI